MIDDKKLPKDSTSVVSTENGKPHPSDSISLDQSEGGLSIKSIEKQSSSGLIPPSGLFKNPPMHRLYIFVSASQQRS